MPQWISQILTLSLSLSYGHQLGLAFLLGSFAVATWSDLKRLSAQREFLQIWLAFLAVVLAFDIYDYRVRAAVEWQVPAIKWGLIVLFSLFSLERLPLPYRLFRLAVADVAALATTASLLTPVLVILFYLGAKLLSKLIGPVLQRGNYYPFMPIVSLATVGILAVALLSAGRIRTADATHRSPDQAIFPRSDKPWPVSTIASAAWSTAATACSFPTAT